MFDDEAEAYSARASFMRGFRDILPIIISTVPFGIVYGALAAREGLSLPENVSLSALVYAGASQFVALELWADPLPLWTILLAVLAVNLRHLLYSAALGRRMEHWSPAARWTGFAFLTDPTFAVAELKGGERLDPAYYWGLSLPLYVNWVLITAVGAIFGNMFGDPARFGLDFVVTAYFIHLVTSFRERPNALTVILASVVGAMLVYLLFGSPWHIAGGAVAGMALAAALPPRAQGA